MNSLMRVQSQIDTLERRINDQGMALDERINRIKNRLSQIENDVRNKADTWQLDDEIRNVRSDLDSLQQRVDYP